MAEQWNCEQETAQRHQNVEKAVALPVFFREVVLVLRRDGDGDVNQRVHQEIGGSGGKRGQSVVEPGRRQGEQEAEREHDEGGPVETGGKKHQPTSGEETAFFQKWIGPDRDGGGQGLPQEVHTQSKILQGKEQEDAQPGGGRVAADPDKDQHSQQKMKHKQEDTVVPAELGDHPIQEEVTRFRPACPGQAGGSDSLKSGLIKTVVKAGNIPQGGQKPAGQAHGQQIAPTVFRALKGQRPADQACAGQKIIWKHDPSPPRRPGRFLPIAPLSPHYDIEASRAQAKYFFAERPKLCKMG